MPPKRAPAKGKTSPKAKRRTKSASPKAATKRATRVRKSPQAKAKATRAKATRAKATRAKAEVDSLERAFSRRYNPLQAGKCSYTPTYAFGKSPKTENQPCGVPPDQRVEIIWTKQKVAQDAEITRKDVIDRCCYAGKNYRKYVQRYGATFKLNPAHTYAQIKSFAQSADARGTKLASDLTAKLNRLDERMAAKSITKSAVHTELQSMLSQVIGTKGFTSALDGVFEALPALPFGAKALAGIKLKKATPQELLRRELAKVDWPSRYMESYDSFMDRIRRIFEDLGLSEPPALEVVTDRCERGKNPELDLHQKFPYHYLADVTPYRGLLAYWSVGAGKTAAAWALLSMYKDLPDWQLIWVTKPSLMSDMFKDKWAYSSPIQSDAEIKRRVKFISYRMFSNALESVPQNDLGKEMVRRARRNGYASRLAKTLVIVDEAHYLYDPSAFVGEANAKPNTKAIEESYAQAYAELAPELQPKSLLLTATPLQPKNATLLKLLNLLIERNDWRFPTTEAGYIKKFANADGKMTASGRDEFKRMFKGLDTCYDGRVDRSRFAQPILAPRSTAKGSPAQLLKLQQSCLKSKSSDKAKANCYYRVANFVGKGSANSLQPASINVLKDKYNQKTARKAYFSPQAFGSQLGPPASLKQASRKTAPKLQRDCGEKCYPECGIGKVKAQIKRSPQLKQRVKEAGKPISAYKAADRDVLCQVLGLEIVEGAGAAQSANEILIAPKIEVLLANIARLDAADRAANNEQFKHLIFSSAKQGLGANLIASAMAAQGFDRVKVEKRGPVMRLVYKNQTLAEISRDDMRRKNPQVTFYDIEDKPQNGFVLMTEALQQDQFGSNLGPDEKKQLRKLVFDTANRRPENSRGALFRFILLDDKFQEGVDVFDVKYTHLFEPQLTESKLIQAIGRGTRRCGQAGLPFGKDGWNVYVHRYVTDVNGTIIEDEARQLFQAKGNLSIVEEQLTEALYLYAVSNAVYQCRRFRLEEPEVRAKRQREKQLEKALPLTPLAKRRLEQLKKSLPVIPPALIPLPSGDSAEFEEFFSLPEPLSAEDAELIEDIARLSSRLAESGTRSKLSVTEPPDIEFTQQERGFLRQALQTIAGLFA